MHGRYRSRRSLQLSCVFPRHLDIPDMVSSEPDKADPKVHTHRCMSARLAATRWGMTFVRPGRQSSVPFTFLHDSLPAVDHKKRLRAFIHRSAPHDLFELVIMCHHEIVGDYHRGCGHFHGRYFTGDPATVAAPLWSRRTEEYRIYTKRSIPIASSNSSSSSRGDLELYHTQAGTRRDEVNGKLAECFLPQSWCSISFFT